MSRPESRSAVGNRLMVWWTFWAAIVASEIIAYVALARGPLAPAAATRESLVDLIGTVPLFLSIIARWLVWPRARRTMPGFAIFIAGVGLSELTAILGILLGGPYRDLIFVLGILSAAQFVPLDVRRFYRSDGSPISE